MMEKIKNKFTEITANKTIMVCMFLSVLYLISGYFKWFEIAVSVCALVFMAILPLQSSFCIFMFLHSFTLSNIGYDSCFMVTMIGYCIILLVKYWLGVKQGKYVYYKKLVIALATFLAVTNMLSLLQPTYNGAWLYMAYFPLFYFLFAMRDEFDIAHGMNFMLGGLITSSALALATQCFPDFQYEVFMEGRFNAFINHPNYLYMRALFVLSYFMYRYLSKNLSHLKFALIYIICAGLTILTLSKTGIVMLALLTTAFIILYLKDDFKGRIKIVGIFMLILLILALISFKFLYEIFLRFASSSNSDNILNSLLTGRGDIWGDYMTACFSSPIKFLFGHGLLAQEVFIQAQQVTRASHNLYIFLLYRFGLVGTIALGFIIYNTIKLVATDKPKLIAYLPMIYLLIESLCDNTFKCYNITYFAFAFMILFMSFKHDDTQQEQAKINKQKSGKNKLKS